MIVKITCPKCNSENVQTSGIEIWICNNCQFKSPLADFTHEDISHKWPDGANKYEGIEEKPNDDRIVSYFKKGLRELVDAGFAPYLYQPYIPLYVSSPIKMPEDEKPL